MRDVWSRSSCSPPDALGFRSPTGPGNASAELRFARSASEQAPQVLLVEDSVDDAELSLRVLSRSGVASQAKWVRDGAEAMAWLTAGDHPSLKVILLDLQMPRMDGYEVLRRIKRELAIDDIPIIVMVSAHGAPEVSRCFELGADFYLVKPLEAQAFEDAMRSLGAGPG